MSFSERTEVTVTTIAVDGIDVLSYERVEQAPPLADNVRALAEIPLVVAALHDRFAGWSFVSSDHELTDAMLDSGATISRHGHRLTRAISDADTQVKISLANGLKFGPLVQSSKDLARLSELAYGTGHVDFDAEYPHEPELTGLLNGEIVGPFMANASWQIADGDQLVGAIIINRSTSPITPDEPWVSEVFRDPDPRFRGLGRDLLHLSIRSLAQANDSPLGLVVTEGNPAAELYRSLGFTHQSSFRKLRIPNL